MCDAYRGNTRSMHGDFLVHTSPDKCISYFIGISIKYLGSRCGQHGQHDKQHDCISQCLWSLSLWGNFTLLWSSGKGKGKGWTQEALLLISGVWAWAIMSIKTARPAAIKEQTVKVSQFLRACKGQTVILWISAIGNFYIIRRQRACKE